MSEAGRIVKWVDPFTNAPLIMQGNQLKSKTSTYSLKRGIPNFVYGSTADRKMSQVQAAFGYKWSKTDFGQDDELFEKNIKKMVYEFMGLTKRDLSMFDGKLVLDVGIGSGSSARVWAARAREFHGVDFSTAVYRAGNALKSSTASPILSQADLHHLPYKDESFDVIVSNGVLHHTASTKNAIKRVVKKLKRGGVFLFYVYKKKAPLREYADDLIRSKISDLRPELAWKMMKEVTKFAKSIHDQSIMITVPELHLLGIKKGDYDLQRFIYQFFFKCFWNDGFGFEDSNSANFDWYYPKFAWRQTEDEIRGWCKELRLRVNYIRENESGYGCLVTRP
jgi:arsenite methyltransferase